jgi:hypothetical protein
MIGNLYSIAKPDVLVTHKNGPYKDAIVADLHKPCGLNIESGPCVSLHTVADY